MIASPEKSMRIGNINPRPPPTVRRTQETHLICPDVLLQERRKREDLDIYPEKTGFSKKSRLIYKIGINSDLSILSRWVLMRKIRLVTDKIKKLTFLCTFV